MILFGSTVEPGRVGEFGWLSGSVTLCVASTMVFTDPTGLARTEMPSRSFNKLSLSGLIGLSGYPNESVFS